MILLILIRRSASFPALGVCSMMTAVPVGLLAWEGRSCCSLNK